jgi:hypothetical protein
VRASLMLPPEPFHLAAAVERLQSHLVGMVS